MYVEGPGAWSRAGHITWTHYRAHHSLVGAPTPQGHPHTPPHFRKVLPVGTISESRGSPYSQKGGPELALAVSMKRSVSGSAGEPQPPCRGIGAQGAQVSLC